MSTTYPKPWAFEMQPKRGGKPFGARRRQYFRTEAEARRMHQIQIDRNGDPGPIEYRPEDGVEGVDFGKPW